MTGEPMIVLETERLVLRRLSSANSEFILELLNQPSFLRYIGDKAVRNSDDAINYIQTGPVASYERFGFGLYLVELKDTAVPIGMCGLLKRDSLPDVDVGFAFLPAYWSRGYAFEAAVAVMNYGREILGLRRIVAITSLDNEASMRLLEKLGLKLEGLIKLAEDQPEVRLFGTSW
ncbi:MAG TPA: GNAT family N-acetyltransferase [Pyrinomonadaceae bacterium]|nr:GNAT family N-acetyltransferase [Pyrinomonadaceae bacterium]